MVRPRSTILAIIAPVAAATAFAASLSLAPGSLGADQEVVPRCTAAGLGVIQNVSGITAISVTVSSLPSGCGGATLQVTLNNQVTSSGGSATVPAGGGSVTVTLAVAVAITAAEQVDLVLTGP
jgi:hypothetical protein